jgi:hypothetical protein
MSVPLLEGKMARRLNVHHAQWTTAVVALLLAVLFFVLLTLLFAPPAHAVF